MCVVLHGDVAVGSIGCPSYVRVKFLHFFLLISPLPFFQSGCVSLPLPPLCTVISYRVFTFIQFSPILELLVMEVLAGERTYP